MSMTALACSAGVFCDSAKKDLGGGRRAGLQPKTEVHKDHRPCVWRWVHVNLCFLLHCRSAKEAAEGEAVEAKQKVAALQEAVDRLEADKRELEGTLEAVTAKMQTAEAKASLCGNHTFCLRVVARTEQRFCAVVLWALH